MPRRTLQSKLYRSHLEGRDLTYLSVMQGVKRTRSYLDPIGEIPGTLPEKMVYNYLLRLGVPFLFQYKLPDIWDTALPEDIWTADFQLPEFGIIIEVFGQYWHSRPKRREKDQEKMAYLQFFGYTTYEHGIPLTPENPMAGKKLVVWWEDEIYMFLDHLFQRDLPELLLVSAARGEPGESLLDREAEELERKSYRARMIKARLRPRITPYQRKVALLRRKRRKFDMVKPLLKGLSPSLKKSAKRILRGY